MEPGYCASSVYNEDTVKVIGTIKAREARYLMVGLRKKQKNEVSRNGKTQGARYGTRILCKQCI